MKALSGRTVVITRATEQAESMSLLVESFDAQAIVVPLIEIVDEPAGIAQLASLDLTRLDWIAVTSPNGARRVAPLVALDSVTPRIAAIGASTAAKLPRCELIASTQSARGLLHDFPQGPGRVAVVQAFDAEPTLLDGLVEQQWDVVDVRPYRTVTATPSAELQRAALAADAVLFASGSAARAWVEVFGTRTPRVVLAIGPQTAAAAERAGLKISATSADHSMYGMLVALSRYFSDAN